MRLDRSLLIVVLGLTALFTMLDPPPSAALSLPAKALFWLLHIGVGMGLAVMATAGLARGFPEHRPYRAAILILLGGLLGSLCFAPLSLAIESLWPGEPAAEAADDWLDRWEQRGGLWPLLAEWLSLLPPNLSSWLLIHALPVGAQWVRPAERPESGQKPPESPAVAEQAEGRPETPADEPATQPSAAPLPTVTASAEDGPGAFLAALPPAIGQDLVAIQADLHYLQVRTTRGRAMVLASLGTAEQALGDRGLRVHRSHWVALAHIRRLARSADGMLLVLSDGSRVPVSRRRASTVKERLGHSFVIEGD